MFSKYFFLLKSLTGEASNRDRPIPHPILWINKNVLPWSVRLCGLWEWGFALQLRPRQKRNKPLLLQSVQANHSTSKFFCVYIHLPLHQIKIDFFLNVKLCHNKMKNILTSVVCRIITFSLTRCIFQVH